MWVMSAPDGGDLDTILDTALHYANGNAIYELSDAERAAVHSVCQLYDNLLGQPHADLRPNDLDGCRAQLHDAYGQVQVGGRLKDLRARLLAATDNCPYCGFGEPRELDHYLPRSTYGELAIYPKNLIPSCGPCNNAKRTVVPGMAAAFGPGLIHAYFQVLPDTNFLTAELSFNGGVLDVSFRISAEGIDAQLAEKLQFQLTRLKLNQRYPAQINKFLSEQRTAILLVKDLGPDHLSNYLHDCAETIAGNNGRNDWRVALLRALSEDGDFCDAPELYLGV